MAHISLSSSRKERRNPYFNLGVSDKQQWRQWLATTGPILARIGVDITWDNVEQDGLLDVYKPSTNRGGHAIAIVGYTSERWIIRNSWGDDWGDDGYAYASHAYVDAGITEAYGVIV